MTFFSEKISISTAKISDDFFSSSTRFSRFSLSFPRIFPIFTMLNVIYDPFLPRKTTISEKNSFMTPFLLCSYFHAHPTTLLLKILGGRAWAVPPPQIWGDRPPSPSRSPPLASAVQPFDPTGHTRN